MTQIEEIENIGNAAVKRLRIETLKSGHHFMINSKELPSNQCYFEYPDGSISLVTLLKYATTFTLIRMLSQTEATALLSKYNLPAYQHSTNIE